jgi:hypothetical protein
MLIPVLIIPAYQEPFFILSQPAEMGKRGTTSAYLPAAKFSYDFRT